MNYNHYTDVNQKNQAPNWTAAADYLAAGYGVVPLDTHRTDKKRGKVPPFGFPLETYLSRHATAAELATWAQQWPDANIGIVTGDVSGIAVLDLDTPAAIALAESYGLPYTPTATTGKGKHVYFANPGNLGNYTGKNALLPGMDFKAGRGYVVAPPSVHYTGKRYTWIVSPDRADLAPLPAWILALVAAKEADTAEPTRATLPNYTARASNSDLPIIEQCAAALGVKRYNAAGWANVNCPFHEDHHASATWNKDGSLVCHEGCLPGPNHVSHGKKAFGYVDVARQLGFTLPPKDKDTHAPANAGLWHDPASAGCVQPSNSVFPGFFPLYYTEYTKTEETRKKSRPAKKYSFSSVSRLCQEYGIDGESIHYARPTLPELSNPKAYRAAAYAYTPEVAPGQYKRSELAREVGVSNRTAQDYDKAAGIVVTPDFRKRELTAADVLDLPDERKDMPGNMWLESLDERLHSPTKTGLKRAIEASVKHSGQAIAFLVKRNPNYYMGTMERDTTADGLPIEVRKALIVAKQSQLARLLDVLLLNGFTAGDTFTIADILPVCAQYGLGKSQVYAILKNAPLRKAEPAPVETDDLAEYAAAELGAVIVAAPRVPLAKRKIDELPGARKSTHRVNAFEYAQAGD